MSEAAKLKPCPFCGGEARFERIGTPLLSCIVACLDCGASLESPDEGEHSGRSWNTRSSLPPDAAGERREALQAKIDALMLEYCPDDMTAEQVSRWESRQRPVSAELTAQIKRDVGTK